MYKNFIFVICLIVCFVEKSFSDEYTDLIAQRNALKEQISAVDSEIARCEKSMKGWKAATIIGGIGAVASGIGIIVEKNQIKKNEQDLQEFKNLTKVQE